MEQTTDDLNEEYSLNTSTLSQDSSSVFDEPESSSNATSKSRKAVESSVVPWRFCLSQLQKCKDLKNRTKFKELITKYSQSHFQQRKKDALAKGKLIWTDFDSRYGIDAGDNWLNVEADLIAREDPYYSFVNILVKADPSSGVPCRAIKRVNGECRGHPEHTIKTVKDPRTRLKKAPRTVPLLVPKYPLDDYIDFAPPRREIAFIELNDNVNHDYLHEFCCARGKRELVYLQIFTHPNKKSHLGMALAEFKTTEQAMDFYEQCGPVAKIMGFSSKIFVDTLGFWTTDEYTRLTGEEPPSLPTRRELFKDEEQIRRIRELIRRQNRKDGIRDNQMRTPPMEDFQDNEEVNTTKPAGARTPVEDMPNSSSTSINSLSRSNSNESMEQIEDDNEPPQRNGRSPSPQSPITNGHSKRRRSYSPTPSRQSRDYRNHNGHSHSSRRRDDFDDYRDRKRKLVSRDDRHVSKYRRQMSISPDRTRSSYKSSRKRSVSSSSTRSDSSGSHRNRSKRAYRDRSTSKTRRSESRTEKQSEVSQPTDAINLCVQPPPAPYELNFPFSVAFPPPFFPNFFSAPPIPAEPKAVDSIPTLAEDAPVRLKSVQREMGPFFVVSKTDRVEFFKQMRMAGYYNESGIFVIPTLKFYNEKLCSYLVTEFFVELEPLQEPAPANPLLTKIDQIKEQLKTDLLQALKASMCQKIETKLYQVVDQLHDEYTVKQKELDEERKMKRPETKQIFDFDEQFSNSNMGTRSVFGSNRMWQLNRNIYSTKKIPKKNADVGNKKQEKNENHKKSTELKSIKETIKRKLMLDSPSSSYKSPSPAIRSSSRASSISSVKKSPHTPSMGSPKSSSSRSSSLASPTSGQSSGEESDNEEVQKRKISSTSSGSSASQATSPKTSNAEPIEDSEMDNLQITQSRTMRKVDYCEDDSSESAGDSDWAEQFGIGDEAKEGKKHKKHKHKSKQQEKEGSDSEESDKQKERQKKTKMPKPFVVKEETPVSPEAKRQSKEYHAQEMDHNKREIPPPRTPPPFSEPASPIVMPSTIKIEPQLVETKHEPLLEVVVAQVEKPPVVVKPPKPKVPKPKPIELPPQGNVQRFPNARFPIRSNEDAKRLLFDYADEEDAQFIMLAARNKEISITQMSDGEEIKRPVIFVNPFATLDPLPVLPSPKLSKSGHQRRNSSHSDAIHCIGSREGAARLIAYERGKTKLTDEKSSSINYGFIEVTKKDEQAARNKQEKRRELRALQRNLVSTVGDCSIVRQNVFKFREKLLKFARSSIHGWGLFTLEDIQPNDMIIEYVGELVRPAIADVREFNYTRKGIGSSYLFRMDDDSVVDATGKGNVARFINHSCVPNCYAKVIGKEQKAICIYAKRFIARGEEITYDYQFPLEDQKIPCYCGAPLCRGFLN